MEINIADGLKVWVLAGQSNMEGCGCLRGCSKPDHRVMSFTSAGKWEVAEEPLHRLWESYTPVHQAILRDWNPEWTRGKTDEELAREAAASRTHGAGLGLPFASELADRRGGKIGLIPCAHGGTSLDQWSPDLAPELGTMSLYGAMMDRINRAGGQLQGILWYQGESDCSPELGPTYEERFTRWIESVRKDTGNPNLPVVVVQLGTFVPGPQTTPEQDRGWDMVRDALADIAFKLDNVAVVSAIDLERVDLIHISTAGLERLGKRMAAAADKLLNGAPYCSAPRVVSAEAVRTDESPAWANAGCILLKCEGVAGGWLPRGHMAGFTLCGESGEPHQNVCLIEAGADKSDPAMIRLVTNIPPDETVWVGYGRGLAPYCNVVDEDDMSLLSFKMRVACK